MEDGCCCGVAMFDAIRFHNFLGCFVCQHHTLRPPSFTTLSCPLSLLKPSYSCSLLIFVVHMWGLRCFLSCCWNEYVDGMRKEKRVLLGPKSFIFACHTTILVSLPLTLFLALAHVPTHPNVRHGLFLAFFSVFLLFSAPSPLSPHSLFPAQLVVQTLIYF